MLDWPLLLTLAGDKLACSGRANGSAVASSPCHREAGRAHFYSTGDENTSASQLLINRFLPRNEQIRRLGFEELIYGTGMGRKRSHDEALAQASANVCVPLGV